jgi:hypothetical protein
MIISSFIIQANVITIVNYDHKTFIVQATELEKFSRDKHSNLLGTFISYEENEMLCLLLIQIFTPIVKAI